MEEKFMGRFKLLDLKYIMIQRWGKAFGRGFPLMSWQEEFLKGKRITPNAIGYFFKDFQKLSQLKNTCVGSTKDGKTSKTKIKSWVKPNKTLVIKEIF